MPFRTDDGRPLDELAARAAARRRLPLRRARAVRLRRPRVGRRYRVPARPPGAPDPAPDAARAGAHGITDLASVPMWLWSFIASYGRQSAPAVLHDERSVDAADLGDAAAALAQRREDDRVFRTALREQRRAAAARVDHVGVGVGRPRARVRRRRRRAAARAGRCRRAARARGIRRGVLASVVARCSWSRRRSPRCRGRSRDSRRSCCCSPTRARCSRR